MITGKYLTLTEGMLSTCLRLDKSKNDFSENMLINLHTKG